MPRSITLAAYLNAAELKSRYRRAREPVERSHLRVIWLLASNRSQPKVAALTGYSTRQIRAITRRYNEGGPEALGDRRRRNVGSKPLLDTAGQAELMLVLAQPPVGWRGVDRAQGGRLDSPEDGSGGGAGEARLGISQARLGRRPPGQTR